MIDDYPSCWRCGRNGSQDPLDRHHIFGGAYRAKSEKYGLVVRLCHNRCHIFGKDAAHRSADTAAELHRYGQIKVMQEQHWTVDRFISEFGRNHLEETMNECKYCQDEICVNADCPMRADYCPVPNYEGVCRYEDRGADNGE